MLDLNKFVASKYDENKCVGVKPCFGILYGVGFALIAEAFASSLYHVCPNSTAFHFDTPFIEIMCALAMAQLYSTRRNFSQFSSVVLAGAVMTYHCVVDLISGSAYLKYFLLSFHLIFIFFLKAKIFLGPMLVYDILHPVSSVQSIFSALKNSGQSRLQTKRIILFTCSLAVNVALIVVLFWMPVLPQSYSPLCFIVTNMLLYFIYYILNKVMCGESLSISSCVCLSLSIFLWALSAFFFMHSETNWLDTSAQSRAYNDECVLLGFYDWHDIWHFSSSFASFFSLLTLTFLDDDLAAVERDQIVVF